MTESGTLSEEVADFAVSFAFRDIPSELLDKVRIFILDSLGCQLLGSSHQWNALVRNHALAESAPGPSSFVNGGGKMGTAQWTALANGTSAQGFEADDYHPGALCHPGAIAVPTALAVAEEMGSTDEEFLSAVLLGFEMAVRFGVAAAGGIQARGIHSQTSFGPLASAITASKLLDLSRKQTTNAIGIAGSHAGGLLEYTQTGGEVKRLHSGLACMGGIRSASLAKLGLTAPPTVLEGRRGFYQAFSNYFDPAIIVESLGSKWLWLNTALKRFPANGFVQAPLAAVHSMISDDALSYSDVDEITVTVDEVARSAAASIGPHPREMVQAQFSIQFSLAMALVLGGNEVEDYLEVQSRNFADPVIGKVAELVSVVASSEEMYTSRESFLCRVDVKRHGMSPLTRTMYAPGSSKNPLSRADVMAKFVGLARGVVGEEFASELAQLTLSLGTGHDALGRIGEILRCG